MNFKHFLAITIITFAASSNTFAVVGQDQRMHIPEFTPPGRTEDELRKTGIWFNMQYISPTDPRFQQAVDQYLSKSKSIQLL